MLAKLGNHVNAGVCMHVATYVVSYIPIMCIYVCMHLVTYNIMSIWEHNQMAYKYAKIGR